MDSQVTYKKGCKNKEASIANIKEFGKRARMEDLESLSEALRDGKVFAWETGWLGYKILQEGKHRVFFILSIFNETRKGIYSTRKDGDWFWAKFKELADNEGCTRMKFQTKRDGMVRWAGQFGFKVKSLIMEVDL